MFYNFPPSQTPHTDRTPQRQLGPKPRPLLAQEQRHPVHGERTPLRSRPPPLTPTYNVLESFRVIIFIMIIFTIIVDSLIFGIRELELIR